MKKTLLIAAAALAASVISSQAQVYSQNIVGYVNKPLPNGYNTVGVPLDASGGNSLTNLIPGIVSGALDNSSIYVWTGTTYTTYFVDSSLGGLADAGDNNNVPSPTINPGQAIFISAAASNTVTFVGSVHVDGSGTGTNVVGVTTNSISGLKLYGSALPVGGGLNTVLGLPTSTGALDNSTIYIPNIVGGSLNGFTAYFVDSSLGGTGIADAGDNNLVPEPQIPVGGGFFLQAALPAKWVQSF